MKAKSILVTLCVIILGSCNNSSEKTRETKETATKANESVTCYEYAKGSNKVRLSIVISDNIVIGDLLFEYYQKDKNKGTIQGEMKGDTLFADYRFMSEGVNSIREVAFLRKGNVWVEGYGDVEEQNGKFVFKNNAALTFNNYMVLHKVSCN